MVIGALAPLLDSTMVNVAIKTIAGDLKSTVSGWAIKRFGGKRLYIFSLIIFLIGSILSSMSWNINSLICFRFLQGIGEGLIDTNFTNSNCSGSWWMQFGTSNVNRQHYLVQC